MTPLEPMQQTKLIFGLAGMGSTVMAANVLGQNAGNTSPAVAANLSADPNILYAMLGQVLNNPSSLMVIAFLCICAWLADDLPFIPSKYVAHLCVVFGASIYWAFTSEETVPKSFPHPFAVFIVNGSVCGFVAFIIHRQAVARIIDLVRGRQTPDPRSQIQDPKTP